jgi:hypothetical protein
MLLSRLRALGVKNTEISATPFTMRPWNIIRGENRWTHPPVNGGDIKDTLKVKLKEIDG